MCVYIIYKYVYMYNERVMKKVVYFFVFFNMLFHIFLFFQCVLFHKYCCTWHSLF